MVIGLTGGIATGKTTVSGMLFELGAVVVNADEVGHEALRPRSQVWGEVVGSFGMEVLGPGGEIDRQKLGEIVFGDAQMLKKLNQIMHPRMYRVVERRVKDLKGQGTDVVVLEAALLIEANWIPLVDKIWVTTASEATVRERLRKKGFSSDEALARIRSQLSLEKRTKWADVIIDTDCTLVRLRARVKELWDGLHGGEAGI